jgi:hypothetical protein
VNRIPRNFGLRDSSDFCGNMTSARSSGAGGSSPTITTSPDQERAANRHREKTSTMSIFIVCKDDLAAMVIPHPSGF